MDHAGVEIRIGVLSVEGMGGGDVPRFQQELARELVRLVEERGLPPGWSAAGSLGTLSADLAADDDATVPLARRVAGAVYGGMGS